MATKRQLQAGITIPIGADIVAFSTAINEIDKSLTATRKEVSALQAFSKTGV
jgi:hypothetical protein